MQNYIDIVTDKFQINQYRIMDLIYNNTEGIGNPITNMNRCGDDYMLDEIEVQSKIFKALSDKKRLEIMQLLSKDKLTSKQLIQELNITQSDLLHHLKILCEVGVVDIQKVGKQTYYILSLEGVRLSINYLKKFE